MKERGKQIEIIEILAETDNPEDAIATRFSDGKCLKIVAKIINGKLVNLSEGYFANKKLVSKEELKYSRINPLY